MIRARFLFLALLLLLVSCGEEKEGWEPRTRFMRWCITKHDRISCEVIQDSCRDVLYYKLDTDCYVRHKEVMGL